MEILGYIIVGIVTGIMALCAATVFIKHDLDHKDE